MTRTRTATEIAELYARHEAGLRKQVDELNELLGLADADHRATFGYIGNCSPNGGNDDRAWYVFLPHPGRVGTADDRLGGFSTGSAEGVWATRKAVSALIQGVRLARSL